MKHLILPFLILLLYNTSYAQDTAWSKLYDFCPDASIMASNNISQFAEDSFLIAAGHTSTPGVSSYHPYLARIGYDGNLQLHKYLYFPGDINIIVEGYSITKHGDNKYVMAGFEYDVTANKHIVVGQPFLYIFNKNLDSIAFVKHTDTVVSHAPWSVIVDKQKNIVVTGNVTGEKLRLNPNGSFGVDSIYTWIAKYDSNANLLWSKKYFGEKYPTSGYKIILNNDSTGYILTAQGINHTAAHGKVPNLYVMKVDTGGNVIWQTWLHNTFTGDYYNNDITATMDGNYAFVASYSDSIRVPYHPGSSTPYVFYGKINDQGDTLWTKKFRLNYSLSQGRYITEAENGDLLLFYSRRDNSLIRTSADGTVIWHRTYRLIDTFIVHQRIDAISYTPQKKILMSGYLESRIALPGIFDSVGTFSWFVLTDTFGCLQPGCQAEDTMWLSVKEVEPSEVTIKIYPNPATDILHVELPQDLKAEVAMKDLSGRTVYKHPHQGGVQTIHTNGLSPGIYIVECRTSDGRVARQKLVHK